jgi:tRNA ligase
MGKTLLALALNKILPEMVHVQSDNVKTNRTGPTFLKEVKSALKANPIVFADRYVPKT